MKKLLFSSLLLLNGTNILAKGDSETLLQAAKTGNIAQLTIIFSEKETPNSWTIDTAFQQAFEAGQSKDILTLLLQNSSTKGQLLRDACTRGDVKMVDFLLEYDRTTSKNLMDSIASIQNIEEARNTGHKDIAKTIQDYLLAKGYLYAKTIKID